MWGQGQHCFIYTSSRGGCFFSANGAEITRRKQKEEPEKSEHGNTTAHGTIPGISMLLCEITHNQSSGVTCFVVRI